MTLKDVGYPVKLGSGVTAASAYLLNNEDGEDGNEKHPKFPRGSFCSHHNPKKCCSKFPRLEPIIEEGSESFHTMPKKMLFLVPTFISCVTYFLGLINTINTCYTCFLGFNVSITQAGMLV
ncbi:transmembrane protein, putative [Medicago truncatula]|uniref:Transmembrane protein, putative n=1 Tax=Medicago truncatula TaxID=3880 RepID=G7KCX9_MEDTR|nr:transmembrane protein, putative [Medicago truncatula]